MDAKPVKAVESITGLGDETEGFLDMLNRGWILTGSKYRKVAEPVEPVAAVSKTEESEVIAEKGAYEDKEISPEIRERIVSLVKVLKNNNIKEPARRRALESIGTDLKSNVKPGERIDSELSSALVGVVNQYIWLWD